MVDEFNDSQIRCRQVRAALEQAKGRQRGLLSEKEAVETLLEDLTTHGVNVDQARLILQTVAQMTQEKIQYRISNLVTMALETIPFDEDYRFHLEFIQRRGQTEADLYLTNQKGDRVRIIGSTGGGVVNVVAFALRVAIWSLSKQGRATLILDEPFHFLHNREAHRKVSELLYTLSHELKIQFIVITGEDESEELIKGADRVFRVRKIRGKAEVSRVV